MARHDPETPTQPGPYARRVATTVCIAVGIVAVALFLWYSVKVLLLAFASILIAAALRGMATWLASKLRLPIGGALALVIVGLVGLSVLVGVLLAPSIAAQFNRLADQLPQSVESAEQRLRQYEWGRKILGASESPAPDPANPSAETASQPKSGETIVGKAVEATTRPSTVNNVAHYARRAFEAVFTALLVIVVGIYLAAQPRVYVNGLLLLFPKSERPRLCDVLNQIGRTLQFWLLGQLVPMAAIGIFVGGGLWLIGVPLWLPLGILTALLNFIPNFGPLIAAVPQVLIALSADPSKALWVVALNIAAQNLEGYLITPLVQRKAVRLPPALTILSQVLMGLLLGPLGIILAAPLTAAAIVAVQKLYVEDTLGTPVKDVEESTPK